jgi:hypothetical protein
MPGSLSGTCLPKRAAMRAALLAATGFLGACSGDSGSTSFGLPSPTDLSLPVLPSVTSLLPQGSRIVGNPTEVYTRLARGALTCWFGAAGPLKDAYVYHAEAHPPSRGGGSEIIIFAKDIGAQDPRALRAYRVVISFVEGATKLEIENIKIPEPLVSRLNGDVARWARDETGCGEGPTTAGWSAKEVPTKTKTKTRARRSKSKN